MKNVAAIQLELDVEIFDFEEIIHFQVSIKVQLAI
jgi:hypothetical protein